MEIEEDKDNESTFNDFQRLNPATHSDRVYSEMKNGKRKRKQRSGSSSISDGGYDKNGYIINEDNTKRVGEAQGVSFLNTSSTKNISDSEIIEDSTNQSKKSIPNSSLVFPVAVDSIDKNVVFNCDNFEQCNSDSSVNSLSLNTNSTYIDTMANVPELHAAHEHLEMVQLAQDRSELLRLQETIENAELDASFKSDLDADPLRDSFEDARPTPSSVTLPSLSSKVNSAVPINGMKTVLHHQSVACAKRRKRSSQKHKEKVNVARAIESSYDEWSSGALLRDTHDVSDESEEYFTSDIQAAIIYEAKELVNDALKAEAAKDELRRQEEWKENKSSKPDQVQHVFTLPQPTSGKERRAAKRANLELEAAISKAINPEPYYLCFEANFSKETQARVLNAETKQQLFKLQETRSALDSGATVNIGEVDTYLKDYSTKGRIPIQSFSGNISWSLGCGTSFGHCVDINNKKIDLIILQVHNIGGGSDHDLLSISLFLDANFSFHLTPTICTMVTPEGNVINLERSGGLIFLKWFKTVKTGLTNDDNGIIKPYHKSQTALHDRDCESLVNKDVISEATPNSHCGFSAVPTIRTSPTESCCYLQMLETTNDVLENSVEESALWPLPSKEEKSDVSTNTEVQSSIKFPQSGPFNTGNPTCASRGNSELISKFQKKKLDPDGFGQPEHSPLQQCSLGCRKAQVW